VLGRTFGTKVKEVRGEWKKKKNAIEELHRFLGFRHGGVDIFDLLTCYAM